MNIFNILDIFNTTFEQEAFILMVIGVILLIVVVILNIIKKMKDK